MPHCSACGYCGPREFEDQCGSKVIPVFECPDCGRIEARGCDCADPLSHLR